MRGSVQVSENPRRNLPQVQRLLELAAAVALCERFGRPAVTSALRDTLQALREQIAAGLLADAPDAEVILDRAGAMLADRRHHGLRRTINATGIILHTNMGRADGHVEHSNLILTLLHHDIMASSMPRQPM